VVALELFQEVIMYSALSWDKIPRSSTGRIISSYLTRSKNSDTAKLDSRASGFIIRALVERV
jgi:hypothetical protein